MPHGTDTIFPLAEFKAVEESKLATHTVLYSARLVYLYPQATTEADLKQYWDVTCPENEYGTIGKKDDGTYEVVTIPKER